MNISNVTLFKLQNTEIFKVALWYSNGYELCSATRRCVRDSKRGHYITVRRGHYMTVKEDITHDSKKRALYDRRRHYMTVRRGSCMTEEDIT